MKEPNQRVFLDKFLCRFTLWFFGLSFALVLLPQSIGNLTGGLTTDWVSFSILLIGIITPVLYLVILTYKKMIKAVILFPVIIYLVITVTLSIVDFGSGWGGVVMIVGSGIQGIGLISVIFYGMLILRREKAYVLLAYLLMIVILNFGYVIDSAIIFYPEAYASLPIYSLISYILCWVILNILYRLEQSKKIEINP